MIQIAGKHHDKFTQTGLKVANQIVETLNLMGIKARIGTTWLDCGQDWTWETILTHSQALDLEYQLLYPVEFNLMNDGTITDEQIRTIIKRALELL